MSTTTQTQTTVTAPLNFYKPTKDGSQYILQPWIQNQIEFNPQTIPFHDIRGHEADFNLDDNGFQYVKAPTTFQDWDNDSAVRTEYLKSMENIILKTTGGTKVHFYTYRLRDSSNSTKTSNAIEPPAEFPHVDLSLRSAHSSISSLPPSTLPPDWSHLSTTCRWALFSIWRPTVPVVTRSPLCVCDYKTLDPNSDLKPYTMTFGGARPDVEGVLIRHSEKQRWWFMKEMGMEDVVFIKNFDSKSEDGVARCCPHGSFLSEEDFGGPRKSIEARCIVFWEGEKVTGGT